MYSDSRFCVAFISSLGPYNKNCCRSDVDWHVVWDKTARRSCQNEKLGLQFELASILRAIEKATSQPGEVKTNDSYG